MTRMTRITLVFAALAATPAFAADHADSPLLVSIPRHDARITDLYAFASGENLVLATCTNPTVGRANSYVHPEDLTVRFHVDTNAAVSFDDADANATFGGDLLEPGKVSAEITLEITFDASGNASIGREGLSGDVPIALFVGMRDDPFIRAPRTGLNAPCIVAELPMSAVTGTQSTILAWSTTKVPDVHGPISELGGRALRSMFPENAVLNNSRPRNHYNDFGLRPDVIIYDTSRAAAYPNGRALADDVVDLVGDGRVLGNDAPFPSENDVPFLTEFPYIAPPHVF